MAKATARKPALSGSRTRIIVFLPTQHDNDAMAAAKARDHLETLRTASIPIGGFTTSRAKPPVFYGAWFSDNPENPGWCREGIMQVIFDVEADLADDEVEKMLAKLRTKLQKIYASCGSAQEEFWIMCHPIVQFA